MDEEPPALLSIGIASGGISNDNRAVRDALNAFQRLVIDERKAFMNQGLRVNLVFHVPGHLIQPDYGGVHATRLDKKRAHLLVVSAVPADLRADRVRIFAAEVLQMALVEATVYLAKRKITLDMSQLQALVKLLVLRLTTN